MLLFRQSCCHICSNKARSHAVYGNTAAAQLTRQSAGHTCYASLGCCVVGLTGVARGTDHAGHTDDAAKALLHHGANSRTTESENSLQIGIQNGFPVLILHAHGQGVTGDAGIIDQHMQTAFVLDQIVNKRVHACGVVHIQIHTTAALGSQGFGNTCCTSVSGGSTNHSVTTLSQLGCNGRANTARCASHQRNLFLLFGHASNSFTSVSVAGS